MMKARALVIAWREGKSFIADQMSLIFSLVLPLALLAILIGTFSGRSQFTAAAYVVDLDGGPAAREFADRLADVDGVTVRRLSEAQAAARLDKARIYQALVIPAGFSDRVAQGRQATIAVRRRGMGDISDQVIAAAASGIAWDMSARARLGGQLELALAGATGRPADPAAVAAAVSRYEEYVSGEQVVRVEDDAGGRTGEPVVLYFPGMLTMFGLFATTLASASLVQERKSGMLERLMACGATRPDIVLGKFTGYLLRGMMQVLILCAVGAVVLRIFTPASFLEVLALSVPMTASFSALGLFIASVTRTHEQAIWTSVVAANVMSVGGGSFFDASAMKGTLGAVARLTPNFYANDGLRAIIGRGESLWAQWPGAAVMAGMAAALLFVSVVIFVRRREVL